MKNIINKIEELLKNKEFVVVAIEGCAASGKSTLAETLKRHFKCEVVKMDHFFLPLHKRTNERLNIPGGNIDYERFKDEVINNLGKSFFYRVFNCSKMQIDGDVYIKKNRLLIIEGSYSLHPFFGKYYDLSIFIDIDYEKQLERILIRDGEVLLQKFIDKWIKYEEKYFSFYNIKQIADIYLDGKLLKKTI